MQPKVLIVARDPGAAGALIPVAKRHPATVTAFGAARLCFERAGIACSGPLEDADESVVENWMDTISPEVVLTGTSRQKFVERDGRWWRLAREKSIPSIALLDHWAGYREKFSAHVAFDHTPHAIAVMDAYAKHRLEELGCPAHKIAVTGQPAFDALLSGDLPGRMQARRRWGCDENDWVVVFASEPQAEDHGISLGYDELQVLRMAIEALSGLPAKLVIKPHPRETPQRLHAVLKQAAPSAWLETELSAREAISAADCVVGMTSIFLLEAALAGRRVLSIQPSHPMEWTARFSRLITTVGGISQARHWLSEPQNRQLLAPQERALRNAASGFPASAAENVWQLVCDLSPMQARKS